MALMGWAHFQRSGCRIHTGGGGGGAVSITVPGVLTRAWAAGAWAAPCL